MYYRYYYYPYFICIMAFCIKSFKYKKTGSHLTMRLQKAFTANNTEGNLAF